jgi:hypothetical protein
MVIETMNPKLSGLTSDSLAP